MNNSYRYITKIQYKNETFIVFRSNINEKYAFIKYDEENKKALYPTIDEFIELNKIFTHDKKNFYFRDSRKNRYQNYKFAYKVKLGTILVSAAIASTIICGKTNDDSITRDITRNFDTQTYNNTTDINEELSEIENINFSPDTDDAYIYDDNNEINIEDFINNIPNSDIHQEYSKSGSTYNITDDTVIGYNVTALDQMFGTKVVTLDDIYRSINNNKNLSENIKEIIKDFAKTMSEYYPNLDLRVFNENMKTLKIKEVSQDELGESSAFYRSNANTIFINKNAIFKEDTLDIVTLRHELGHTMNMIEVKINDKTFVYQFQYYNNYEFTNEALTVIMTSDPFMERYNDELKSNVGYPQGANTLRVILNACPNLNMQDLFMNNFQYFTRKIDETSSSEITAKRAFDIFEVLMTEHYNPQIKGDRQKYYEFYRYIGQLYLDNVINESMDEEDINYICDWIKARLRVGVYDDSLIYDEQIIQTIKGKEKTNSK